MSDPIGMLGDLVVYEGEAVVGIAGRLRIVYPCPICQSFKEVKGIYRSHALKKTVLGSYPNDYFDSFAHEAACWGKPYWPRVYWRRFKRWFNKQEIPK